MLLAEGFFVTGMNLTVDLKYICTHPTESLKDLVMSTNLTLISWVKEQSPGFKLGNINIIAGDFITESHFVPTVVALNRKLLNRSLWLFFLFHKKTVTIRSTAWNAHNMYLFIFVLIGYFLVTWKILELLLICKCTYWMQGNLHFSPKSCFLAFLPALLVCLHLGSAIYSDDCDTFHESAK